MLLRLSFGVVFVVLSYCCFVDVLGGVSGVDVVDKVVVVTVVVLVAVVVVVLVRVNSGMVSSTAAVQRILKCDHQHSLVLPACPHVYLNMLFEQRKHNTNQTADRVSQPAKQQPVLRSTPDRPQEPSTNPMACQSMNVAPVPSLS